MRRIQGPLFAGIFLVGLTSIAQAQVSIQRFGASPAGLGTGSTYGGWYPGGYQTVPSTTTVAPGYVRVPGTTYYQSSYYGTVPGTTTYAAPRYYGTVPGTTTYAAPRYYGTVPGTVAYPPNYYHAAPNTTTFANGVNYPTQNAAVYGYGPALNARNGYGTVAPGGFGVSGYAPTGFYPSTPSAAPSLSMPGLGIR